MAGEVETGEGRQLGLPVGQAGGGFAEVRQVGEGVAQAKNYANKLQLDTTFAANGKGIYRICMKTGEEGLVTSFPTPQQLWDKTFPSTGSGEENSWRDKFDAIPLEGHFTKRFYQEIAINNTLDAIAKGRERILLTLATGTGKTIIAF